MAAYQARPAYQQNDYLGWIARAMRPETQAQRLAQMLDELEQGRVYMPMALREMQRVITFQGRTVVVEADIRSDFDQIPQQPLLNLVSDTSDQHLTQTSG